MSSGSASSSSADEIGETIDVCGDGGVMKVITKQGSGWEKPSVGMDCKAHYVGTFLDGTKFDSSRDRGTPLEFHVGEGIKGWSECIKSMKKGEICKVTLKPEYAYGAPGSPPVIPPNATLQFEIELITFNEEKDITKKKNKGVIKRTLTEGSETWKKPKYESKCTVHLKITSKDKDTVYLDTHQGDPITVEIGDGKNFSGLEKILKNMCKGEISLSTVTSSYAYGQEGCPQYNIPPNSDLLVHVELLGFEEVKEDWSLDDDAKLVVAGRRKNEGNDMFQKGLFKAAERKYSRVLKTYSSSGDDKGNKNKEIQQIKLLCHLNSAACHLKLNNNKKALEHSTKALEIDDRNVKGLWRQGLAYQEQGDWERAKRNFQTALEIEPGL
eukprot:TRINITY_DN6763_c0_g1_i19.p1 TRINITY_DN6763_c0_g1~~TRINITY_DN6763_c0_g1_i19.p1  ORF type:complete len:383 (-),score=96.80 TRINITY_DN6763_c0_g1_i19:425-1573(-)